MLLSILALALSAVSYAGDASEYTPLGFSPEGRYFAFAQTGVQDGSGFAYADAAVVDVARNIIVADDSIVLEEEGDKNPSPQTALKIVLDRLNLKRFNIVAGRNLGENLLVRLPTDFSQYTSAVFSYRYWAEGGATMTIPKYELVLQQKDAEDKSENKWCTDFLGKAPQMFQLSLVGRDATDGTTQILQNDLRLPLSRGCVGSYSIQRVTTFNGGLVVQLSYTGPGFEGPDVRQMIVTAVPRIQD
jgi:predicted secreted protein